MSVGVIGGAAEPENKVARSRLRVDGRSFDKFVLVETNGGFLCKVDGGLGDGVADDVASAVPGGKPHTRRTTADCRRACVGFVVPTRKDAYVASMTSVVSWFAAELEPVAMRLGRVDELTYQLGQLSMNWSRNGEDGPLAIKQVRSSTSGMLDAVVVSVRPIPPSAPMLFSEVINHLRAALDNVVFHLVTQARGQALPDDQARKVALPIYQQQSNFEGWAKRIVGKLPELGDPTADLYQRIETLQPYASTADVPSLPPLLAALSGVQPENVHALLLLQSYSNEDKHRAVRLAVPRTIIQRSDVSFYKTDRKMQPIEVGDILASVREGEPILLESNAALHVERPDTGTWVSPGAELAHLHDYVAHVAIPMLITGTAPANPPLPESIDLSDNGQTLAERINGGGQVNAHERMRIEMARVMAELADQPPTRLRTEN